MGSFVRKLDSPLLHLSPEDPFTLRDACEGVHVFGAIGSGKTSGTGKALASAYLRAGMGGLILCAKPDEVQLWLDYAKENGRAGDLIRFDATRGFNFIDYEIARQGLAGIGSVTDCVMYILEAADHAARSGAGGSADPFWDQAIRQVLTHSIPLLYAAWGSVTVGTILRFVTSAADDGKDYLDPEFVSRSFAAQTLRRFVEQSAKPLPEDHAEALADYWFAQYPAIPERTRGNIVISLSTKLDRFKLGRLRTCFCDRTNVTPEMTFHGALILMEMPTLTWNDDGIIAQQLVKYMWQRAVEARNGLEQKHRDRPVFLWADEAQYFVNAKDAEFLSTCRSSRACVVYLTQNLPTYYAALGERRTAAADSLVGKFRTQVFHQNGCPRTNKWASELIGRAMQWRETYGQSTGTNTSFGFNESDNNAGTSRGGNQGTGRNQGTTNSHAQHMDHLIEPRFFTNGLKSGGRKNGNRVTALWFNAGARFEEADGGNYLTVSFEQ